MLGAEVGEDFQGTFQDGLSAGHLVGVAGADVGALGQPHARGELEVGPRESFPRPLDVETVGIE